MTIVINSVTISWLYGFGSSELAFISSLIMGWWHSEHIQHFKGRSTEDTLGLAEVSKFDIVKHESAFSYLIGLAGFVVFIITVSIGYVKIDSWYRSKRKKPFDFIKVVHADDLLPTINHPLIPDTPKKAMTAASKINVPKVNRRLSSVLKTKTFQSRKIQTSAGPVMEGLSDVSVFSFQPLSINKKSRMNSEI